jgi:hypothetical protein
LKAKNIYINPLLKPKNTWNKLCFETAYLGENLINLYKRKVAQNVAHSLGYFSCAKNHNEPWQKIDQSGHPDYNGIAVNYCSEKFYNIEILYILFSSSLTLQT